MGTYTTNYQMYMPTVGEQGWGELVNGNFTTIDTTMKGLDTRVETLETETDAVEERVTALEPLSVITVDGNQNVTFPGNVIVEGTLGNFKGNAETASELNRVVNVTPSTNSIRLNTASNHMLVLPYIPGVLYSGTMKGRTGSNSGSLLMLSEDNVWSSKTLPSSDDTITVTRVKMVIFENMTNGTSSYLYLPVFS